MARSERRQHDVRARWVAAHGLDDSTFETEELIEGSYSASLALGARRGSRTRASVNVATDGSLVCSAPGCKAAVAVLHRLGHRAYAAAVWLHIGPIEKGSMSVVTHGACGATDPLRTFRIDTPTEYAPYVGFMLDELALVEPPDDTDYLPIPTPCASANRAVRAVERPLSVVYARARRIEGGPGARFEAAKGRAADSYAEHLGATMPGDKWPTYVDALALITGRVGDGLGRPPLPLSDHEKAVVIQAEALYIRYAKRLSYPQVAASLNYDERRLRTFRSRARRFGFYETDEYRDALDKELRKHGSP